MYKCFVLYLFDCVLLTHDDLDSQYYYSFQSNLAPSLPNASARFYHNLRVSHYSLLQCWLQRYNTMNMNCPASSPTFIYTRY